jgi:hypothetical protein
MLTIDNMALLLIFIIFVLNLLKLNNPPSKKVDLGPRRKASFTHKSNTSFENNNTFKRQSQQHITTAKGGGFLSYTKRKSNSLLSFEMSHSFAVLSFFLPLPLLKISFSVKSKNKPSIVLRKLVLTIQNILFDVL